MSTHMSLAGWDAAIAGALALLDGGTVVIYTGSQPATPDSPATGTALATLSLGAPAFQAAAGGAALANAIASVLASTSGQAGYFRAYSSGDAGVLDGSVGAFGSGADMIINDVNIIQGGTVSVRSWSVGCPDGQ